VAVELSEAGGSDIWTVDLARGVATRVTFDPALDVDPVWSPDGRELMFATTREGPTRIYSKALRGNAPESPLGEYAGNAYPEYWSAHANAILFVQDSQVGMLSLEGDAKPEMILKKDFSTDEPQLSPDGHWLAYISQESGQWEVYVEPFREEGERVRVSTEGGGQPKWRGDGRELFYVSPDGQLMAVDVRMSDGRMEVGLPVALFPGVIADAIRDHYAVTADGQRFLVPMPVGNETKRRLHVITSWTSLLK
jgi:Tol biopolymer transport system component